MLKLIVEPSQDSTGRTAPIVLYERHFQTGFAEVTSRPCLKEETSVIPKYTGYDELYLGYGEGRKLQIRPPISQIPKCPRFVTTVGRENRTRIDARSAEFK